MARSPACSRQKFTFTGLRLDKLVPSTCLRGCYTTHDICDSQNVCNSSDSIVRFLEGPV